MRVGPVRHRGDELGLDGRVERRVAARDGQDRAVDLLRAGVLGEVAARAGAQGPHDGRLVGVRGERDDARLRAGVGEPLRRLDPVAARHAQVHQHHVGGAGHREPHGLLAVGRRADDLDVREQADEHRQPLAHHALVVGEQHADRIVAHGRNSSTRNPSSVGPATSRPPSSSARSRMPVRP